MSVPSSIGSDFVKALSERSDESLRSILAPDVDFKGLTPGRFWEAQSANDAINDILWQWFEEQDVITEVLQLEEDAFADRTRVGYRLHIENPDGPHVVEQQAYFQTDGERITWMRVVCSGFRPLS